MALLKCFFSTKVGIKACLAGPSNERLTAVKTVIIKIINTFIVFVKSVIAKIKDRIM